MERLTGRVDMGLDEFDEIAFLNPHDPDGLYNLREIVDALTDEELLPIADRLAAYEDTGLAPEEARELAEKKPLVGVPFERVLEIFEAEAEGRLVVLAKEGEDVCGRT